MGATRLRSGASSHPWSAARKARSATTRPARNGVSVRRALPRLPSRTKTGVRAATATVKRKVARDGARMSPIPTPDSIAPATKPTVR